MTKRRPINKKGKLNIQWFSLKKKKKKMLFSTKGGKNIESP